MDNYIGLVFSSQAFCFSNGRILTSVCRGDPFIAFTPYGPTFFMGHHVLMPCPSLFALTPTFKKDFYQFNQNGYPRFGGVAFRHVAFIWCFEDTAFIQEGKVRRVPPLSSAEAEFIPLHTYGRQAPSEDGSYKKRIPKLCSLLSRWTQKVLPSRRRPG